jgi:plastocyanin
MQMKKVVALLALALAAVALVACGGDDDEDTTNGGAATEAPSEAGGAAGGAGGQQAGGGSTFKVAAVPDSGLAYTTEQATVEAGDLTIEFENPQTLTHDVAIEDSSGEQVGKTELIADSSTSANVGKVEPGDYTFYCTVPGHREGGMEGTLTVE